MLLLYEFQRISGALKEIWWYILRGAEVSFYEGPTCLNEGPNWIIYRKWGVLGYESNNMNF